MTKSFLEILLGMFRVVVQVLVEAKDRMRGRNLFNLVLDSILYLVECERLAVHVLVVILLGGQVLLVIGMIVLQTDIGFTDIFYSFVLT